jgi:hypothetical protein
LPPRSHPHAAIYNRSQGLTGGYLRGLDTPLQNLGQVNAFRYISTVQRHITFRNLKGYRGALGLRVASGIELKGVGDWRPSAATITLQNLGQVKSPAPVAHVSDTHSRQMPYFDARVVYPEPILD